MIAARVYTTVHMYTRRAAPELCTELKADTGRYVDVHSHEAQAVLLVLR